MSIKSELEQVKAEFKSDEKLLEGAFRIEKFYKRYKWILLFIVVAVIAYFGDQKLQTYQQQQKSERITQIYNEVLENPNNLALQERLKETAPELYDLYQFSIASKQNDAQILKGLLQSSNEVVKILANYTYASLTENKSLLKNSPILKELSALQEVGLLYKENSKDSIMQAHKILGTIPLNSSLYAMISILKHYGATQSSKVEKPLKQENSKSSNTQGKH
ncbi:hypothetical protein [Helicobacter cetorum]|uniref:hypothetical protein n=1 Tax=Helicobacter cetorum TaxID=138563 RepID=UPI000CF11627|nr:hypothetical protein [Helicobacter cetorum]